MTTAEVKAFIDLMKAEGVVSLRVGELALFLGTTPPPPASKDEPPAAPEPMTDPLDDPEIWPGGQILRVKRREVG
jgi:hypothetical protein